RVIDAQAPARDVQVVHAVVAHVAARIVPHPLPAVVVSRGQDCSGQSGLTGPLSCCSRRICASTVRRARRINCKTRTRSSCDCGSTAVSRGRPAWWPTSTITTTGAPVFFLGRCLLLCIFMVSPISVVAGGSYRLTLRQNCHRVSR